MVYDTHIHTHTPSQACLSYKRVGTKTCVVCKRRVRDGLARDARRLEVCGVRGASAKFIRRLCEEIQGAACRETMGRCCLGSAEEDQRRSTKKPVGERVSSADVRWGETCAVRVTYVGITRRCFAKNCRCCVRRNEDLVFSSKMQEKRRPLRSRRAQSMCSGTEGDVRRVRRPELLAKVVRAGEGYPKRED